MSDSVPTRINLRCAGAMTLPRSYKVCVEDHNFERERFQYHCWVESEGETVIAATLARWLNVSAPAVTMAIKRLKRDYLIQVGPEGQLTLTDVGPGNGRANSAEASFNRMDVEVIGGY